MLWVVPSQAFQFDTVSLPMFKSCKSNNNYVLTCLTVSDTVNYNLKRASAPKTCSLTGKVFKTW